MQIHHSSRKLFTGTHISLFVNHIGKTNNSPFLVLFEVLLDGYWCSKKRKRKKNLKKKKDQIRPYTGPLIAAEMFSLLLIRPSDLPYFATNASQSAPTTKTKLQ